MRPPRPVLPVALGALALAGAALLLATDAAPGRLPPRLHDLLGALPLELVAVACFARELARRSGAGALAKATLASAAFLAWAASQLSTEAHAAAVLDDVAIALFVLDAFLVVAGRPRVAPPTG